MIHVDPRAAEKAVSSSIAVCKAFGIDAFFTTVDYFPDGTELRPYLSFDTARAAHPEAPIRLNGYAHIGQSNLPLPQPAPTKTDKA